MFGTRSKMENLLNYKKAALPAGRPEWAAEKKSMLTTRTLSALLRWARNNVDEPLEEVRTAGDTLRLRLRDGRTGVLYLEDGEPRLVLPAEI